MYNLMVGVSLMGFVPVHIEQGSLVLAAATAFFGIGNLYFYDKNLRSK